MARNYNEPDPDLADAEYAAWNTMAETWPTPAALGPPKRDYDTWDGITLRDGSHALVTPDGQHVLLSVRSAEGFTAEVALTYATAKAVQQALEAADIAAWNGEHAAWKVT